MASSVLHHTAHLLVHLGPPCLVAFARRGHQSHTSSLHCAGRRYIPFGFLLQDRLVAVFELGTSAIVLINGIDIFGQMASLAVVLYREFDFGQVLGGKAAVHRRAQASDYHEFYVTLIYPFCGFIAVVNGLIFMYFFRKAMVKQSSSSPAIRRVRDSSFNIQDPDESSDMGPLIIQAGDASRRPSSFLRLASAIEDEVVASSAESSPVPGGRRRRTKRWSLSSAFTPNAGSSTQYLQCSECDARFTQPEV